MRYQFAPLWHAADKGEHKSAKRINIFVTLFRQQIDTHPRFELVNIGTTVSDQCPVRPLFDGGCLDLIMFVLDLPDDLFHKILNGDETVSASEFIDHKRHMDMRFAHAQQQVEHRHCRRYKKHVVRNISQTEVHPTAPVGEQIFDVHKTEYMIQRVLIDRQSRVESLVHGFHDLTERCCSLNRNNIGPRDHHIVNAQLMQLEDVHQHQPLFPVERPLLFF